MAVVRKKPKTTDEAPVSSKPGYKGNRLSGLKPPWKPGQSGNPRGRPVGSGGTSIVKLMRTRLQGRPITYNGMPNKEVIQQFETLADQLGYSLVQSAIEGKIPAIQLIIDKTEPKQIDEEQLKLEIERVFNIICRHVHDKQVLANIARDLNLMEDVNE